MLFNLSQSTIRNGENFITNSTVCFDDFILVQYFSFLLNELFEYLYIESDCWELSFPFFFIHKCSLKYWEVAPIQTHMTYWISLLCEILMKTFFLFVEEGTDDLRNESYSCFSFEFEFWRLNVILKCSWRSLV